MSWDKTAALRWAILFTLLWCVAAHDQTNPGFLDGKPLCANYPNANCPAPANPLSLNQAFMNKADYSAVNCTNTSADVPAINAALAKGGIVQLPAGTCLVGSTSLSGVSNTWLRGYGKGVTILSVAPGSTAPIISFNQGGTVTNDVRISDMTIQGNNVTPSAGSESILLQNATNVKVDHVSITSMAYQFGIVLQGVTWFDIVDNDCTLTTAANTQNECYLATQSLVNSNGHITRNYATNSGMEIDGHDIEVADNVIANWQFGGGITMGPVAGTYSNIIRGNKTFGSTGTDVNDTSPNGLEIWSYNSIISHNTAYNNSGSGILAGGANTVITGNVTYDNGTNVSSTSGNAGILIDNSGSNLWQTCNYCVATGNSSFNTLNGGGPQTYALEVNANVVDAVAYANNLQIGNLGITYGPLLGWGQSLGSAGVFTPPSGAYSMQMWDTALIFNATGSTTLTLIPPNFFPGRQIFLKTIASQTVVSATANVVPINSATPGTAILAGTAGTWAILMSDGVNWIVMAN
jgi:hypothetical protein